jgi:hypothetical protein
VSSCGAAISVGHESMQDRMRIVCQLGAEITILAIRGHEQAVQQVQLKGVTM